MNNSMTKQFAERVVANIGKVIVGKSDVAEMLLVALIAKGHILLEDVPGTGKTMMAKALAKSIDCQSKRVQFTPDLLPSDLTGIHYYNQQTSQFEFRAGPVFTNILLTDEINRATPRTQSSLLECMEERQVSIDGVTMTLEHPFLVIATENPIESHGTFPLPEAQLDRFLLQVRMGYPSTDEGMQILRRFQSDDPLAHLSPVAKPDELFRVQQEVQGIAIHDDVLRYLLAIVEATRSEQDVDLGVSPRGSQALLRSAQARAGIHGRSYVTPDDIKTLAGPVLAHRLVLGSSSRGMGKGSRDVIERILNRIPTPTEMFS